jgi:hypothetical protein
MCVFGYIIISSSSIIISIIIIIIISIIIIIIIIMLPIQAIAATPSCLNTCLGPRGLLLVDASGWCV